MTQARQWWVLVRYKDEPGAGFGKQYITATNAYEAIQMAKALYGKFSFLKANIIYDFATSQERINNALLSK